MSSTNTYIITEYQRSKFKPTYLMIKQHQITGKKYFCKTTRNNPIKYLGSGKYWKSHIQKYGKQYIETKWYKLFTNIDELVSFALNFSYENNIVESDDWANLIFENGLDGGSNSETISEQTKIKMSLAQTGKVMSIESSIKKSIANNGQSRTKQQKNNISIALTGIKKSEEHKKNLSISRTGKTYPKISESQSYKWVCINTKFNQEYKTTRLKEFCKEHNLNYSSAKGSNGKISKYGINTGWIFKNHKHI